MIDVVTQGLIAAEVRAGVLQYVDETCPLSATCFYHAVLGIEAIRRRGVRAILQAGTTMWRHLDKTLDDGVRPTHFGYQWEPNQLSNLQRVAHGLMPEMHVWSALVDPPAIIDFTTDLWPDQALRLAGITWTAPRPPAFLWGPPTDASYLPDRGAVTAVLLMAARVFGVKRARELVS